MSSETQHARLLTAERTPSLLQELVYRAAARFPAAPALVAGNRSWSYADLEHAVRQAAGGFRQGGLGRQERVAVYLPKSLETVAAMFGAAAAGGAFVPVNPVLKGEQVGHILRDSGARVLVTSGSRLLAISDALADCPALARVILTDGQPDDAVMPASIRCETWADLVSGESAAEGHRCIDADMVAIFYTSGSTGLPKGVVLSHRNMVAGATSVASYLENVPDDRILSLLPLSFDAGFSQLTTGFHAGACVVLLDYLLAGDVVRHVREQRITGITGVPPLWSQLADATWPPGSTATVRYFATTGGVMPRPVLDKLRAAFPGARPFLMYGLTEAFRSTYLPPEEVDRRPDSIGRAIPNAEVLVLRPDGTPCEPGEPGELVHRGALVALGYWKNPAATAERFKPVPGSLAAGGQPEIAVWSGDTVVRDAEGFLYFRGRRDEMIKSSGYRVSPTEVEDSLMQSGLLSEVVAVGVPDERLGQAIVLVAVPAGNAGDDPAPVLDYAREKLPAYMVPRSVVWRERLPRNANGKFDRVQIKAAILQELGHGR
ncbi:MAG: acyl-CoA ligase (AMP-forming), exosortase A system-associated [Chromatiales bacterium]|nr:acyl-CoA ligase (AMP-forming), exosortase A system-associated [Chromatiales bacterium]